MCPGEIYQPKTERAIVLSEGATFNATLPDGSPTVIKGSKGGFEATSTSGTEYYHGRNGDLIQLKDAVIVKATTNFYGDHN